MTNIEEWRAIPGYEGIYQISNLGRIKRIKLSRGSSVGRIMKASPGKLGYPRLSLCRDNCPQQFQVHSLVAAAFLGPRPKDCEVNHKDGDPTNPCADNLEYVTSKENSEHAIAMGLMPFGVRRPNAKFTDEGVREARQLYDQGWTQKQIAERFHVSRRTAGDAITGRLWKHVT